MKTIDKTKTYIVTIEAGAWCESYQVTASNDQQAYVAAVEDFEKENPRMEITHTSVENKSK